MVHVDTKNELIESVKTEINKRISSTIYGTFAVYWAIFHWKFLVALFIVGGDQILTSKGLLKTDYLYLLISDWKSVYFYVSWITPIVLTYLTIWYFPEWFLLKAHQKDINYRVEKEKIRLKGEKQILEKETEVQKIQTEQVAEKIQTAKKERELISAAPLTEWMNEYLQFKKTTYFSEFDMVIENIYKNGGRGDYLPTKLLAYIHSNKIVKIIEGEDNSLNHVLFMSFTEKGDYFVSCYTEEMGREPF